MHIIIGGAYNGKRQYVKTLLEDRSVQWWVPKNGVPEKKADVLIWTEIDHFFEEESPLDEIVQAEKFFAEILENSVQFKEVYLILEDIGRGIVPIDAKQRRLRDLLGRLYQLLFAEAETVTRIWYGIPQLIKSKEG